MTNSTLPTETRLRSSSVALRAVLAVLGFTSVGSLLGWVYGVAPFHTLFRLVTLPGMTAILVIAYLIRNRPNDDDLRLIISLGCVAGILGTIVYDVFRIPFIFGGGFLLLSSIESYGVLAHGGDASSGWTDFLGWSYHVSNGIGFGITYMALALRRHWGWGLLYAAVLETGTVLTPFADAYSLTGKWVVISIAYAAHVPYGFALGWVAQNAERWRGHLDQIGPKTVPVTTALAFLGLAVWLQPWTSDELTQEGTDITNGPSALISDASLYPEFSVVPVGGCMTLRNDDAVSYPIVKADGAPTVAAKSTQEVCFSDAGVHRIKPTDEPFDGGFVIVDKERLE